MFNADVEALQKLAASDTLVHLDSDRALGDIKDDARTAVVVAVGHALVDGAVGLDSHAVAALEGPQVAPERGDAMLPEALGEFVTGAMTVSL